MLDVAADVIQTPAQTSAPLDVAKVRAEFPILKETVYGRPLVYLDSAASAQKPRTVIEAVSRAYETSYSNVHRGAHRLSQLATDAFEDARETVARFVNAESADEIVFTRNATEALNLVAASYGRTFLTRGDEIVLTEMEHHANIVPWQLLRDEIGVVLRVVPIDDDGVLRLEALADLIGPRTRLVAITHCSNVLGTVTPLKEIVALAHGHGVPVVVDGSQGIVHAGVDVRDLDVDFYAFTGHKLYGPSGIGVLYGKRAWLERMPPYQGGGEMIDHVSFAETTFKAPPHRFEAGTPPIVQAIGLAAAVRYVSALGMEAIRAHEQALLAQATEALAGMGDVRIFGRAPGKAAIISFLVGSLHPYDVAAVLDRAGIAVRVGQHCAEPLMGRLGVDGTVRASFALYNDGTDVEALVEGIHKAKRMLGG
ncbi:MAG: cysteine desulfurase [Rhodospirillales bacterium]|nr:MAG: cysteine desulfurase [Rhodospirillales bacterium]